MPGLDRHDATVLHLVDDRGPVGVRPVDRRTGSRPVYWNTVTGAVEVFEPVPVSLSVTVTVAVCGPGAEYV